MHIWTLSELSFFVTRGLSIRIKAWFGWLLLPNKYWKSDDNKWISRSTVKQKLTLPSADDPVKSTGGYMELFLQARNSLFEEQVLFFVSDAPTGLLQKQC